MDQAKKSRRRPRARRGSLSKKKQGAADSLTISSGHIDKRIHFIRGVKVMLDSELAELYGVPTSRLNEQVTRNPDRFPEDFMFQLSREEALSLRSQNAILKSGRGQQRKYLPRAFTEHGILMLSSVLRSERAVQVNIAIMRAFVRLRERAASHAELTRKFSALEEKNDIQFKVVFDAIRALMKPGGQRKRRIGFASTEESLGGEGLSASQALLTKRTVSGRGRGVRPSTSDRSRRSPARRRSLQPKALLRMP